MKNIKKPLFAACALILALLACNLPDSQESKQFNPGPNLAGTITAQASTLQAIKDVTQPPQAINATPLPPTDTPQPTDTPTITLTPTETWTPTPTVPMVSVNQITNCRTGPGTQYDLLNSLNVGQTAEVVGKYSPSYWVIKNPSGSGICWLWNQYATVTGNTNVLPEMVPPPTPTPSLPAAPKAFNITISCKIVMKPIIKNEVHVELSWQDVATNEDGYYIYRDGKLIATLDANSTGISDDTSLAAIILKGDPAPSVSYGIEAFNSAGKSKMKDKSVSCP